MSGTKDAEVFARLVIIISCTLLEHNMSRLQLHSANLVAIVAALMLTAAAAWDTSKQISWRTIASLRGPRSARRSEELNRNRYFEDDIPIYTCSSSSRLSVNSGGSSKYLEVS